MIFTRHTAVAGYLGSLTQGPSSSGLNSIIYPKLNGTLAKSGDRFTVPLNSSQILPRDLNLSTSSASALFGESPPIVKPVRSYYSTIQWIRDEVQKPCIKRTNPMYIEIDFVQAPRPATVFVDKRVWDKLGPADRKQMLDKIVGVPDLQRGNLRSTHIDLQDDLSLPDYPVQIESLEFKGASIPIDEPIRAHLGWGVVGHKMFPTPKGGLVKKYRGACPEGGQSAAEAVQEFFNVVSIKDKLTADSPVLTKYPVAFAILKTAEFLGQPLAISVWGLNRETKQRISDLDVPEDLDRSWHNNIGFAMGQALDFCHSLGLLHYSINEGNISINRDGRVFVHDMGHNWNMRRHQQTYEQFCWGIVRDIGCVAHRARFWEGFADGYDLGELGMFPSSVYEMFGNRDLRSSDKEEVMEAVTFSVEIVKDRYEFLRDHFSDDPNDPNNYYNQVSFKAISLAKLAESVEFMLDNREDFVAPPDFYFLVQIVIRMFALAGYERTFDPVIFRQIFNNSNSTTQDEMKMFRSNSFYQNANDKERYILDGFLDWYIEDRAILMLQITGLQGKF